MGGGPERNFKRNTSRLPDENIRSKTAELAATTMKSGQDPDDYFTEAIIKRADVEAMDKSMTDRRSKDIVVQGFTPEYESIKLMMYRDPTFDLAQIQTTMRPLYLDNLSRSNEVKGRIAGRGVAMSTETVVLYPHYREERGSGFAAEEGSYGPLR